MSVADLLEKRRRISEAHFAAGTPIPDIDFVPPCPICDDDLICEDGAFECEICSVTWPRSGYGHEAERHDEWGNPLRDQGGET